MKTRLSDVSLVYMNEEQKLEKKHALKGHNTA